VTITWYLLSEEEVKALEKNRCRVRRSRRSTIQCEQDIRNHADFHAGRSVRGAWYIWTS
jgi:hypothetical protein